MTLTASAIAREIRPLFSRHLASAHGVYLANHSLGRPLDQTAEDVREALDAWTERMDGAWEPWWAEHEAFRSRLARLIGHPSPDGVVPRTSTGQALRTVLHAASRPGRPVRVVTTGLEFDSADFILKAFVDQGKASVTWVQATGRDGEVPLIETEAILAAIRPEVDLVLVSAVIFQTGQRIDVPAITEAAHQAGAWVAVDAYHAVGALPFELGDADFAMGGSYKYMRGGTGACWLAIHPRHLDSRMASIETGWFAKRDPFGFERSESADYAEGGNAWLESTPSILPLYQARAGQEFALTVGVDAIRHNALEHLAGLRSSLAERGLPVHLPANPEGYGNFAILVHDRAPEVATRLAEAGVHVDARGRFVRFGPDILTTADEIERAAQATAAILAG